MRQPLLKRTSMQFWVSIAAFAFPPIYKLLHSHNETTILERQFQLKKMRLAEKKRSRDPCSTTSGATEMPHYEHVADPLPAGRFPPRRSAAAVAAYEWGLAAAATKEQYLT